MISKARSLLRKLGKGSVNKVIGLKEKGLGDFNIFCYTCGKPVNINDTNCPKHVKKLVKRNMHTRATVSLLMSKLGAQCHECARKVKLPGPKTLEEVKKIGLEVEKETVEIGSKEVIKESS